MFVVMFGLVLSGCIKEGQNSLAWKYKPGDCVRYKPDGCVGTIISSGCGLYDDPAYRVRLLPQQKTTNPNIVTSDGPTAQSPYVEIICYQSKLEPAEQPKLPPPKAKTEK